MPRSRPIGGPIGSGDIAMCPLGGILLGAAAVAGLGSVVGGASDSRESREPPDDARRKYNVELARLVRTGKVTQRRANEAHRNAFASSPDELRAAVAEMRRKYGR